MPGDSPLTLSPLACPRCGAAVPLGDGEVARCIYCAIDVPVPPDYIALRDDAKTRVRDRTKLDRLYAEASRPPSRLVRAWAAVGRRLSVGGLVAGALIILATVGGVIYREQDMVTGLVSALFMLVLAIPAFLETIFHLVASNNYDLFDGLGPFAGVLSGLLVWVLVAAPLLISSTCRGELAAIIRLRMRLAAGKPVQPGGPATCRGCGAALDVPSGALGVSCTYCATDNVVAIPGLVAAAEHRDIKQLDKDIEEVFQSHTRQLAAERAALKRGLGAWLLGLACVFEVLYFPSHYFLDGSFTMVRRASSHRGELYPDDAGNLAVPGDTLQRVTFTFTYRCHTSNRLCIHYYVALQRGDRVTFEAAERTDLTFTLQRHEHLVLAVGVWEPWVTDATLARRAPYTGWYRVEVSAPKGTDTAETTLRWSTQSE